MRVSTSFLRGVDAENSCDRDWEPLQMKTFEVRSKVPRDTDRLRRVRSKNSDCDRKSAIKEL